MKEEKGLWTRTRTGKIVLDIHMRILKNTYTLSTNTSKKNCPNDVPSSMNSMEDQQSKEN